MTPSPALEYKGKATGAQRTVERETFYCFATGIMRTEWRTLDKALRVAANATHGSYWASVNGNIIGQKYRKLENAMRDAVRTRNALAKAAP